MASGMGCRIPCLKAKGCQKARDAAWRKQAWVEIVNIAAYKRQAKNSKDTLSNTCSQNLANSELADSIF